LPARRLNTHPQPFSLLQIPIFFQQFLLTSLATRSGGSPMLRSTASEDALGRLHGPSGPPSVVGRIVAQKRTRDARTCARAANDVRSGSEHVLIEAAASFVDHPANRRVEHPRQQHLQPAPMQIADLLR